MPDDRDQLPRTKTGRRTPAGGESIPRFVEPDEEKTPVTSDPFVRLEYHQKKINNQQDLALGEIKALHQKLEETIRRHDQTQERDEEEHRRLSESINRIAKESAGTRARVDTLGTQLASTELAVRETAKEQAVISAKLTAEQAGVVGQLNMALDELKHIRRLEEHEKKITIETEAMIKRTETQELVADHSTKREELVAENAARRARNTKIVQIVGAALGSGGIITAIVLAALQAKC